jgi:3-isopropylmalate dehydratase small subunit
VEVDLKMKEIRFGTQKISIDMRESARTLFLDGTWDSSATLLSAMDAVRAKAKTLPYMNGGATR